ncbi:LPXTG cell wall anchor domain-containing protein [Pseudogracilibacillus sp. SE30717A]|uniref:LPXTG cell wall anchor domain-containing protein n=1 Tax=Pseudogracilibacillus sp. SE30717A TaxID=3098293 RepID=UPI00300E23E8
MTQKVDSLWAALENEALTLNLSAVKNYNTYRKTKLAERIFEKRTEAGEEGFATVDAVQTAVNHSNFELFINPFRPKDLVEPAFNAVNNAESIEEMQAALENENLGLNLDDYNALSQDKKAEIAALVLDNRPESKEGYPLPRDIQDALNQAVEEINAEEPEKPGGNWLTGEGAPQPTQGNQGDLYLDTDTFDIYKKIDEDWQLIGNLKGEEGQDGDDGQDGVGGATWLVGEGAPDVNVGNNGDLYLDTVSGDIYVKTNGDWEQVGNLQGPPGQDGEDGKDGTDGKDGEDGKDGTDGKDGEDGKDGTDGKDGEDGKDGTDGKDGKDGTNGKDSEDGKDGTNGKDSTDDKSNGDDKGTKVGNKGNVPTGSSKEGSSGSGSILPKTATSNPLLLTLGVILLLVGGTIAFTWKKIRN